MILSVSMGVLAIKILAFSMRRGWPMPKLLFSTNPSSKNESARLPPGCKARKRGFGLGLGLDVRVYRARASISKRANKQALAFLINWM